jgi:ATP diphosphatase
MTKMAQSAGEQLERLVEVMRVLRSPGGCPWDREQTLESLSHFVLEETYEVLEAIDRNDREGLREEIGDLLFEAVFLAQICAEAGAFTVADSLESVADKLIRRHPHVFGSSGSTPAPPDESGWQPSSAADVVERWEVLKARERAPGQEAQTTLSGIPKAMPALLRAYKIGHRAAAVGFDWQHPVDVMEKIEEEVAELRESLCTSTDAARAEEEMGDLLFAIANLSRKLGIEPEAALRRADDKFTRRFDKLEGRVLERGRRLQDLTLEEMETEWQAIKDDE